MSFTLYRGLDGLNAIKKEWLLLAEQTPDVQFYQQHQWHGAFLKALISRPEKMIFVVMHEANKLQLILPLVSVQQKTMGMHVQILQLTSHSHLSLVDGLCQKDFISHGFIQKLSNFLNTETTLNWDWISLQNVVEHSSLHQILHNKKHSKLYVQLERKSYFINCKQSLEHSTQHLSTKFKRNIRRQTRKAEEQGCLRFDIKKGKELERCFEEFLNLEASGWKGESNSAIKCHAHLIKFYRHIIEYQTSESQCVLNTLYLDDELIAAQFGIMNSTKMNLLKIAYNENMSKIAPGSILLNHVIQYCVADENITELCFVTAPKWAEVWKSSARDVYHYKIFNTTLKGLFFQLFISMKFLYRCYLKPYLIKFKSIKT